MKLDVSQLLEGVSDELELEFAYEPDDRQLDDGAELREPARVRVVLTRGPQQLWLRGHIDARVQFTCDRCLKPFESELTTSYVEEYRARAADQEADGCVVKIAADSAPTVVRTSTREIVTVRLMRSIRGLRF